MGSGHSHHHGLLEALEKLYRFCPACGRGQLRKQAVPPEDKKHLVCDSCGFVMYLNPKVVACTIPELNGRVLLLKRKIEPSSGKWTFPGGYMDIGESVTEAALRETKEEVALDVQITRLLNVYSYADNPVVVIVYAARIVSGEPRAGAEVDEIRYFAPEEIPWGELAFRSTYDALKDWVKTI